MNLASTLYARRPPSPSSSINDFVSGNEVMMFLLIMTHLINFVFSSCAKAISRESVSLSLYSPHYSAFNFNSFRRLVRSFLRFLLFLSFLKIVKSVSEHRNIKNRRNDIIRPRINSKILRVYFFPRVPSLPLDFWNISTPSPPSKRIAEIPKKDSTRLLLTKRRSCASFPPPPFMEIRGTIHPSKPLPPLL